MKTSRPIAAIGIAMAALFGVPLLLGQAYPPAGSSGGGGVSWSGNSPQIAFGLGGALTGTPELIWDGGSSQIVFTTPGDGGIVLQPYNTIWFVPPGLNNDDQILYFDQLLTGEMVLRTNGLDIGHRLSSGGGSIVTDGDADFSAAKQTYVQLHSTAAGYFSLFTKGNATNVGLAITPQNAGHVMIGSTSDDGANLLQVDGGIAAAVPRDSAAITLDTQGSRICLDPKCAALIIADGGANSIGSGGAGGVYFKSSTIDTSASVNPAFVFNGYGPDGVSPIANSNLVEYRNAGSLEFSVGSGGQVTFSGVTITAGEVFANELVNNNTSTLMMTGNKADGASAVALQLGNEGGALSTAGAKLVKICNGPVVACSTTAATIDFNGVYTGGGIQTNNTQYGGQTSFSASTTKTVTVVSGCRPLCTNNSNLNLIKCSVSGTTLTATESGSTSDTFTYLCI